MLESGLVLAVLAGCGAAGKYLLNWIGRHARDWQARDDQWRAAYEKNTAALMTVLGESRALAVEVKGHMAAHTDAIRALGVRMGSGE